MKGIPVSGIQRELEGISDIGLISILARSLTTMYINP
jgi:hypothetical protein